MSFTCDLPEYNKYKEKATQGIPNDSKQVDEYLQIIWQLLKWLEEFKNNHAEQDKAQSTIKEVEDLVNTYKQIVSKSMVAVNIQKARDATRTEGSILEFGLNKHLQTFYSKIKEGIPKDNKKADVYLKNLANSSAVLSKWLEDFKASFSQYPEQAQPTIQEVESALQYYKDNITAAIEARKLRQSQPEPDVVDKVIDNIKDAFSSIFGPSYKVVEAARESAKGRIKTVEDKLSQFVATPIRVDYNLESFFGTQPFKGRPNSKQVDIINTVFGTLPEQVIGNVLFSILQYPIGRETFLKLFKSVSFNLDINNTCPVDGRLLNSQGVLSITVNMNNALDSIKVNTWRDRLLDVMGILIEVALLETDNIKQQIVGAIQVAMGKPIEVVLTLPCAGSPEFLTLHPARRTELIKLANTKLFEVLLIGNAGITGNLSICEFNQVIDAFNEKVSRIVIAVESQLPQAGVRYEAPVLFVGIPLQDLNRGTYQGLGQAFERLLDLRPVRQEAAIQRANDTIATAVQPLASILGVVLPIQVDWSFMNAPELVSAPNYVQIINHVATVVQEMLMANGKGFNASLSVLASQKPSLRQNIAELSHITIRFDPKNSVDIHIGKSHTLVARVFRVELGEKNLVITTNLNILPANMPGVGRVVQFKLNPVEAGAEEERTINEIAERMRRDEEQYRQNETRRINESNRDKQRQFQQDQEQYKRDIQEYHREVNAKCHYCSGSGRKKCGLCGGRGYTVNNHNESTCWSCNGNGQIDCSNCDGSGLKYPRGLTEPRPPDAPHFESIPEYGPMPDFRNMI